MFKQIIFKISRNKYMGKIVGFLFTYMAFLVPVKKIVNNKNLISFFHPVPSYDQHILIIPKKIIGSILDISDEKVFEDIIRTAIDLSEKIKWENDCVILCANGGKRQDVKQVHFHLFSAKFMYSDEFVRESHALAMKIEPNQKIILRENKSKRVIEIIGERKKETDCDCVHHMVFGIIQILKILNENFDLTSTGYTLKLQIDQSKIQKTSNIYIDF